MPMKQKTGTKGAPKAKAQDSKMKAASKPAAKAKAAAPKPASGPTKR